LPGAGTASYELLAGPYRPQPAERGVVTTTEYLRASGRTIAFSAPAGTAPGPGLPVVLIHGSSFDRRCWDGVLPELAAAGHQPIAYDNPGHGGSSLPALTDVDDGVRLLVTLLDAWSLHPAVLIGHSMGGAVVQRFLQLHPERALAAGLVSTAASFQLPADLVEHWLTEPVAYRQEEAAMIVAPECPEGIRRRLRQMRDDVTAEGQRADLLGCAAWDNGAGKLDPAVPTLLVTAEHDTPLFREQAASWKDVLGGTATLVDVPAAGHLMLVEQPAATAKAIIDWLDTLDRH
jgi:pimeloyl-ACP methyl ester carboxylesterase